MILSLILVALTGVVAYFHYTQGIFSATISAILATIAAIVAVGFHENLAVYIAGGKFTEEAAAISLCVLFAVTYIVPRFLIDRFIPGNVRLPVLVDKIGSGVMGLWVGLLAAGILGIAAQTLPFGPDVGYFARYDIGDKTGQYMGQGQEQDVNMYDVTVSPTLNRGDSTYVPSDEHLWFRQDELVMGLAGIASNGSLAGSQSLLAIHPNYLDETFGQRIGIQVGANHTLYATPTSPVTVGGTYTQPSLVQIDGEIPSLRPQNEQAPQVLQPQDPTQQAILIVRTVIAPTKDAADSDGFLRLSAGSIELVVGGGEELGLGSIEYHPIATLDRRGIAVACRVDDFLIAPMNGARTIDWVFMVDKDRVFGPGVKDPPYHILPGTFLEVKRYSLVDLSDSRVTYVTYGPPTNRDKISLLRKSEIDKSLLALGPQQLLGVAPPTPPQAGASTGDLGLVFQSLSVSYDVFAGLDVRKPDRNGTVQLANGLSGSWEDRGWKTLSVPIAELVSVLGAPGTNTIDHFAPMDSDVMVQFHMTLPESTSGKKAWDWARNVANLELADADDNAFKPVGVWVRATQKSQEYIVASFSGNPGGFNPISQQNSKIKPMDVWIAFFVPAGDKLQELRLSQTAILEDLTFKANVPPASQPTTVGSADPR